MSEPTRATPLKIDITMPKGADCQPVMTTTCVHGTATNEFPARVATHPPTIVVLSMALRHHARRFKCCCADIWTMWGGPPHDPDEWNQSRIISESPVALAPQFPSGTLLMMRFLKGPRKVVYGNRPMRANERRLLRGAP